MKSFIFYTLPEACPTFEEQANNCFRQLEKQLLLRKWGPDRILKQVFFLAAEDQGDYYNKIAILQEHSKKIYGDLTLPTSYIAQSPEGDRFLALEVNVANDEANVIYRSVDGIPYTVLEYNDVREVYGAGLTVMHLEDPYQQGKGAFEMMQRILEKEHLDFSDVVRQWNYIENITGPATTDPSKQNYQVFNDVRSLFYGKNNFLNGYPSATGIGTSAGGIVIEFIAASGSDSFTIKPVRNPVQTDAHQYSEDVLVGKPIPETPVKTSPKFERGKFVSTNGYKTIYVSGTASITGEKTVYSGDVVKQTLTTVHNIQTLVSPENLEESGCCPCPPNNHFSYIRTYVKNKTDMETVKAICEQSFRCDCFQYLISDICREDLLVEIEGSIEF